MFRRIAPFAIRAAVTAAAFFWIAGKVDLASILEVLKGADRILIASGIALFFLAQLGCILRWRLLAPKHPSLNLKFLTNSFFVACFFNAFLPTTIGGDLIRGYDLIKATGEWRRSLASILMDRLVGFVGLFLVATIAWMAFPPAREDPVLRNSFLGLCAVVLLTFVILGNRRVLKGILKPFGKIGLGQLEAHGKQFQESLLGYLKEPKSLLRALFFTFGIQTFTIVMFLAISQALSLHVPIIFLLLTVPIIFLVSQLPISLSGWGVREGAVVLLFQRVGVDPSKALSLSLICGAIPLTAGAIGGILFLLRRARRR